MSEGFYNILIDSKNTRANIIIIAIIKIISYATQ